MLFLLHKNVSCNTSAKSEGSGTSKFIIWYDQNHIVWSLGTVEDINVLLVVKRKIYVTWKLSINLNNQLSAKIFWKTCVIKNQLCPGWCGSVDWVPAWEPKGCQFNSQSGHMPCMQARSLVEGAQEATTHWCFSLSLPPFPSLKINK